MSNYFKIERDPGWIELFFDLGYVVLLGRMGYLLTHAHSGILEAFNIISFIWIFAVEFVIWMYYTVFMNIYGNDSHKQSKYSFVLMSCIMATTVFLNGSENSVRYIAIIFGIMSLVVSFIYQNSKDIVPGNEKYANFKSISQKILSIAIIPTLFMDVYVIIVYMLIIYMIEHIFDEYFIIKGWAVKPHGKHFVERIGVFMILLLGESFVTLFHYLPDDMTMTVYITIALIVVILFALWINYFTFNEFLAEIKYSRYSQILLTNMFIMFGLTLLPAIIYHSLNKELNIQWFNVMLILFALFFWGGNGITYFRVGNHSKKGSLIYAFLPPLIILVSYFISETYLMSLVVLAVVAGGSAYGVIKHEGKIKMRLRDK